MTADSPVIPYLAFCLGGCENDIALDISRSLILADNIPVPKLEVKILKPPDSSITKGEAGCGKLLIITNMHISKILSLRSVQYLLFSVFHSSEVPPDEKGCMLFLCSNLSTIDWIRFVELLRLVPRVQQNEKYTNFMNQNGSITFCVRCIRDGDQHEFKSVDVAKKVGEIVLGATNWKVDLTQMDVEIVVCISGNQIDIGVNIPSESQPFLRSHLPSEVRLPVISSKISPSLRPSTAYVMVMLANPLPGEILVDCMCGSGAVMIEAAYSHGCISLGGDCDVNLSSVLRETLFNANSMSSGLAKAEALFWSAHRLPLRDGLADIVVLDLPFGPAAKKTPPLYRSRVPKFIMEVGRVLRPSFGRCVILSQTLQQVQVCLDSQYFTDLNSREVNIGGYTVFLVISRRSDKPWEESAQCTSSQELGQQQERRGKVRLLSNELDNEAHVKKK